MAILETPFDKRIICGRKRWRASVVALLVSLLLVNCNDGGQQKWGPFRGQVVDKDTGRPMPGVHVMAEWRESVPNPVDTISRFYDAKETVTDAGGHFEIPRLERQSYWTRDPNFKFFAPGYDIVGGGYVVTPPDGHYMIDPTVVRLRPLKTREELCAHVSGPLHEHAPLFRAAVNKYMTNRKCM